MKYAVLIFLLIFAPSLTGQTPKPKPKATPIKKPVAAKPKPVPTPTPISEKEQFEKASAHELAADRVAALESFLKAFPQSENRVAAADLLATSRVLIAEEKLLSGNPVDAVSLFKQVVNEAPQPIPEELFTEAIAKIPSTLFRHGQHAAAAEIAGLIEARAEDSVAQLLEVASFYLSLENGAEAMRVAAKAAAKDPTSASAYRTVALAHRINFNLEDSANAYAKALELEPDSSAAKRGLAEMRRALGKPDEAAVLYRDLLVKNEADLPARSGLVLSLFDAGKRTEAEAELAAALARSPGNFLLLAGAAYWYASHGVGDKAVELAEKALDRERRYIWSHIALARGLMSQGKPVAAEQVLVKARAFGNFPTLEYEIASARMAAGFFREAVEDLKKQFSVSGGGVKTNLGGRVARGEKSFHELVAYERRASIFAPSGGDTVEEGETLRALLELDQKLQAADPDEAEVAAAADTFVRGSDKMKLHRQLFAASLLLQKQVAIAKVLELARSATGNTDAALEVASPGAAVMASELYESRATAFRTNDFLLVPDVPKPTLSAILRGRIEEITGWALYQQGNFPDAIVRLRRAITVMPDKSSWWRSSVWRLGDVLAADGKESEALKAYIDSYKTDKPNLVKYAVVESLYRKVNGTTDGLEAKIGAERVAVMQTPPEVKPVATPAETPALATPVEGGQVSPAAGEAPPPAVSKPEPNVQKGELPKTETIVPAVSKPEQNVEESRPKNETNVPAGSKPEPNAEEVLPSKTETNVLAVSKPEQKVEETSSKTETYVLALSKPAAKAEELTQSKTETSVPSASKADPAEANTGKPDPSSETASIPATTKGETPDQPNQTLPEAKPSAIVPQPVATGDTPAKKIENPASTAAKPLFEPIIITIPGGRPVKPVPADTAKVLTEEKKPDEAAEKRVDDAGKETDAATVSTGAARPRLIEGQEVKLDEPEPCSIGVSQGNISLINGGGSVGILVNIDGPGEIRSLVAISSSPKDIEVTLEPEIGGVPDRRFYIIKSVSSALGIYQVTFAAPCGKKDVIVTVR